MPPRALYVRKVYNSTIWRDVPVCCATGAVRCGARTKWDNDLRSALRESRCNSILNRGMCIFCTAVYYFSTWTRLRDLVSPKSFLCNDSLFSRRYIYHRSLTYPRKLIPRLFFLFLFFFLFVLDVTRALETANGANVYNNTPTLCVLFFFFCSFRVL